MSDIRTLYDRSFLNVSQCTVSPGHFVNQKSAVTITLIKKIKRTVTLPYIVGYGLLQAFNFGVQGNKKQ